MFTRRLVLLCAFLIVLVSAGFGAAQVLSSTDGRLTAPQARAMALDGDLVILDVRRAQEWRQTGMPEGAVGVSVHQPGGRDGFVAAALAALGGDRTRPVATICASGVRSTRASAWLVEAGFTRVYNIKEGLFGRQDETGVQPGWLNRKLPMMKPTAG